MAISTEGITFAVLAAGEGSRLRQEGIQVPKPLVTLGGETLLQRLLRIFKCNGAAQVIVSANRQMGGLAQHLACLRQTEPLLDYVLSAPPSSMHSLYELAPRLKGAPFCLTTVDTVFPESEFAQYVTAFRELIAAGEADGLMGVTRFIDDEKPLYVQVDEATGSITQFLDADPNPTFVSAGIYGLTPRALQTLTACIGRGESRMRNFQRSLLADGFRLKAFEFSKVFDIDHASDIQKAKDYLNFSNYV